MQNYVHVNTKHANTIRNKLDRHRLDFDAAYTAIMNNIDNMLDLWSKKEGICVQCFDGWKLIFKQIV